VKNRKIRFIFSLLAVLIIAASACAATSDDARDEQNLVAAAHEMRSTGRIQLNFKDLEMGKFIHFMSELLGENIIVDPSVSGKVSVVSPKPISIKEARQVMLSVLEMNNLAIQDMGGYSKVLPLSAGPSMSNSVVKSSQSIAPSEAVAIQVVPLKYVKADFVLMPLKSALPNVQSAPLGNGSSIMLSGKASLLNRAVRIIRALDAPDSIRAIKIFTLKYANAKLLETSLNAMGKDLSSKLAGAMAIADERTKRVIIIGSRQALREADRVIKGLDVPSRTEDFHVYRLKNADAKTVAEQLSQILSVAAKLSPDQKGTVPSTVVPDLPTNSLIFTASQEQFNSLKTILAQLDTQPKQVFLRGLIAEVNLTKLKSAGIDWAAWGGKDVGNAILAGNLQMGTAGVPTEIQALYEKLITKQELQNINGTAYQVTNTNASPLMYAYIQMLNKYDAINVLSMPQLMCTDNLQSHLQVGQVIPQMKGSLTDKTNTSSVTNSYEYKDVGLILTVTPHIRSGNLVALEIEQRVEDLLTTSGSTTPITSKREVKTTVLVANGQTVVIGGLIKEAEKALRNRVPIFSYIPLIGDLFKSNEKQHEKVDLMIFLTPTIIATPESAAQTTKDVVNDRHQVSETEKILLMRNSQEYKKSVEKQNITNSTLNPKTEEEKKKEAEEERQKALELQKKQQQNQNDQNGTQGAAQ